MHRLLARLGKSVSQRFEAWRNWIYGAVFSPKILLKFNNKINVKRISGRVLQSTQTSFISRWRPASRRRENNKKKRACLTTLRQAIYFGRNEQRCQRIGTKCGSWWVLEFFTHVGAGTSDRIRGGTVASPRFIDPCFTASRRLCLFECSFIAWSLNWST